MNYDQQNDINIVTMGGTINGDIRVKLTRSGQKLITFFLDNGQHLREQGGLFVNRIKVQCWGGLAETLESKLGDGTRVLVVGEWRIYRNQKEDGRNVYESHLKADQVHVGGPMTFKQDLGYWDRVRELYGQDWERAEMIEPS